jgi:hypothetical protein
MPMQKLFRQIGAKHNWTITDLLSVLVPKQGFDSKIILFDGHFNFRLFFEAGPIRPNQLTPEL